METNKCKTLVIPEGFIIGIDSREQLPLEFKLLDGLYVPTEKYKLEHGDYSIKGLENEICFERKKMSDLISYIGKERERTMKKLEAMKDIKFKCLVIEVENPLETFRYSDKVKPAHVFGFFMKCRIIFDVHVYWCHYRRDLEYFILSHCIYFWDKKIKQSTEK